MDVSIHHTVSHFPCLEGTPNLAFIYKFWVNVWTNDMVWTIRGLYMLLKAPPINLVQLRKVMIYFSSNGCISIHCIAIHLLCIYGTQSQAFCTQFESWLRQKWHGVNHTGLVDSVKTSYHSRYASKEVYNTLQQQWMSLLTMAYHFSCRNCNQNLVICIEFESGPQQKWHFVNHKGVVDAVRSSSLPSYASKEGYRMLQ